MAHESSSPEEKFAKTYSGMYVKVNDRFLQDMIIEAYNKSTDDFLKKYTSKNIIGRVIGWKKYGWIAIEPVKKLTHENDVFETTCVFHHVVDFDFGPVVPSCYLINHNYLEIEKSKPVKTFPHICKLCSSPAKNIGKFTLCSNVYCKSKRTLLKGIGPFPKVVKPKSNVDSENYVICSECSSRVGMVNREFHGKTLAESSLFASMCRNKHYLVVDWKDKQKLQTYDGRHYIYSNGTFQHLI